MTMQQWRQNTPANRAVLKHDTACWVFVDGAVILAYSGAGYAGGFSNHDTWEDFSGRISHFMVADIPVPPAKHG